MGLWEESTSKGPWGEPQQTFRMSLVEDLRRGPIAGQSEVDAARSLLDQAFGDLMAYGTSGGEQLGTDPELETVQKALVEVLRRLGIELKIPWRNYTSFREHWIRKGCANSYQARRDLLHELFDPVFSQLDKLEELELRGDIAEGVTPSAVLGWPGVDAEVAELRRLFRKASTPQDYRDVGNRCVATLEALGDAVYDPSRHLRDGEEVPTRDKTKLRLERYVEDSLAGKDNQKVRAIVKPVIELAHSVKHREVVTRRDAGIIADSVVLLCNILKRCEQDI